ncbi:MAG: hypothetical protein AAGF30_14900 [Pseudomonadota bacterium]
MDDPHGIYQEHLDTVSEAVWNHDFDAVAARMHYPNRLSTIDEVRTVNTPEVLIAGVRRFRATLTGLAATGYHRICEEAHFAPGRDDMIYGRHRVFILRGGSYATDPYTGRLTLVRTGEQWLNVAFKLEIEDAKFPVLPPAHMKSNDSQLEDEH